MDGKILADILRKRTDLTLANAIQELIPTDEVRIITEVTNLIQCHLNAGVHPDIIQKAIKEAVILNLGD